MPPDTYNPPLGFPSLTLSLLQVTHRTELSKDVLHSRGHSTPRTFPPQYRMSHCHSQELMSNLINLEQELTEASEAEDYEKVNCDSV